MKNYIAVIALLLAFTIPTFADACTGNIFNGLVLDGINGPPVAANMQIEYTPVGGGSSEFDYVRTTAQGTYSWTQPYCGGVFITPLKAKSPFNGYFSPGTQFGYFTTSVTTTWNFTWYWN